MQKRYDTREDWLMASCQKIKDHFKWFEMPENLKVSVGVCSGKAIGTCYKPSASEDKFNHIFIDAGESDPARVIDILIHELCHAHLNNISDSHTGHGKDFALIAERFGLQKPMRATTAGAELKLIIDSWLPDLGAYPHKRLETKKKIKRTIEDEEKSKTYICRHGDYECSIKNKFANEKLPECPLCHSDLIVKKRGKNQLTMF